MAYGTTLPSFHGVGYQSKFGTVLNDPGSRVAAYVRSTGAVSDEEPTIANNLVATIGAGLARCRSGKNDVVFVLPGHAENVTSTTLANLVPGTRILGLGHGSNRPNLRWTATTSQLVMNDADCIIDNFILRMEGAVVVKAVAATAADCAITNCFIDVATTASTNLATIGVEIGAGAHRFLFAGNVVQGVADGGSTKVVSIAGVCDGAIIHGNRIRAATATTTIGVIDISAAATNLEVSSNLVRNYLASATAGISVTGAVACTGALFDNYIGVETGTPQTTGITQNAASLLRNYQNFALDAPLVSGILAPVVT